MTGDLRPMVSEMVREAMQDGGNMALDSAVRLIGRMVQTFTVQGNPQAALGASAAMELVKQLRDSTPELYDAHTEGRA